MEALKSAVAGCFIAALCLFLCACENSAASGRAGGGPGEGNAYDLPYAGVAENLPYAGVTDSGPRTAVLRPGALGESDGAGQGCGGSPSDKFDNFVHIRHAGLTAPDLYKVEMQDEIIRDLLRLAPPFLRCQQG